LESVNFGEQVDGGRYLQQCSHEAIGAVFESLRLFLLGIPQPSGNMRRQMRYGALKSKLLLTGAKGEYSVAQGRPTNDK
jgi:hypothetical protein